MSDIDPKLIESLPKSYLQSLPAVPGIDGNYDNPPTLVPAILGVGSAFMGPAVILYLVRMYTKAFVVKKVFWDDLCCTLGLMFALVYYISLVLGAHYGGIGRHTYDLHVWSLVNQPSLAESYITTVTNAPALGLIKTTLFIQYYLLFWPFRWVRISVWIGSIVSGLFYIAVSISAFALNSPRPGETLLAAILSNRYIIFARFSIPIGVIGMLIDLYLLFLPIKAVAKLQMNKSKKLGMILIFGTGAIASASSIVGLYYRVKVQQETTDETWIVSYLHIFTQVEMFAGVCCACMPSAYSLLNRNKNWKLSGKTSYWLSKVSLLRSRRDGKDSTSVRAKSATSSNEAQVTEHDAKSQINMERSWEMRVYDVPPEDGRPRNASRIDSVCAAGDGISAGRR